jgi:hypothetical protein
MIILYHRLESPTQTPEIAREQMRTGEIWGRPLNFPYCSDIPKVKAYNGSLPLGARGIEFTTEIQPDLGCPPGCSFWSMEKGQVLGDDEFAKISVTIIKCNQF